MSRRLRSCPLGWLVLVGVAALLLGAEPAAAQDLSKLDTSLQWIPADAAFYGAMLRNREQIERIGKSRAWAKLMEMPTVQMGLAMYKIQAANPESVPGKIQAALKDPQVRQLIDLAKDMASQEIFVYGDHSMVGTAKLLQDLVGAMRYGPVLAQATGEAEGLDENELRARVLLSVLAEDVKLLYVPDLVIGFKLTDTAAAQAQLEKLETILRGAVDEVPELKGQLKRRKVAGHEYLTLSLDGTMLPWEDIPVDKLKEYEAEEGDAQKVVKAVKDMKMVVSIGLRDNYLLVAIGSSTKALEQLGKGELLANSPKLQPLARHADKPLVSIEYLSEAMSAQLLGTADDIENLNSLAKQFLPLAELEEKQNQKILADLEALTKDLKRAMPEPGAVMGFAFLAENGIESYAYDWTKHPELIGGEPLTLLGHLGGAPTLAAVNRGRVSVEDYETMVKWITKAYGYFEELALPQIPADERPKVEQFLKDVRPHAIRAHEATRDLLLPALADGQLALVIDTKLKSKQFIKALPPTPRALPMIEPAVVCGVSDPEKLVKAFAAYREAINGVIDAARRIEGSEIPPEIVLPAPNVSKTPQGTLYSWSLPESWGLDERIVLNFGLGEKVGVAAVSHEHSGRLLTETPLAAGGVLAAAERPRAGASLIDVAGLLGAIKPWVDYGFDVALEQSEGNMMVNAAASQVDVLFEVLEVFRKMTSESYFEDDALVTHSLLEIRDLPE